MGDQNEKYIVDEFSFSNKDDYNRAAKEKETISYIIANTDMNDLKAVYKIYNRSIEKKSFQTVIGLEFVKDLRKKLLASGIVTPDTISIIPVPKQSVSNSKASKKSDKEPAVVSGDAKEEIEKYKHAYENVAAGRTIRNMMIAFLLLIIIAMMVITYNSKYSIFTFFTNYKADMENELINKYEGWENELNKREEELKQREQAIGDNPQ